MNRIDKFNNQEDEHDYQRVSFDWIRKRSKHKRTLWEKARPWVISITLTLTLSLAVPQTREMVSKAWKAVAEKVRGMLS